MGSNRFLCFTIIFTVVFILLLTIAEGKGGKGSAGGRCCGGGRGNKGSRSGPILFHWRGRCAGSSIYTLPTWQKLNYINSYNDAKSEEDSYSYNKSNISAERSSAYESLHNIEKKQVLDQKNGTAPQRN